MTMSNEHSDIFFVCWIIERIRRVTKLTHKEIAERLGKGRIAWANEHAQVLHCENPDKVVWELIEDFGVPEPPLYHDISNKEEPSLNDIGSVFYRIVRHAHSDDMVDGIYQLFTSFLPPLITDYNRELYWANREYLVACYQTGEIL